MTAGISGTVHHQCEYVYDLIVLVVLYDETFKEIILNTLILPFLPDYGNKDACVYIHHLCQLFSEWNLL